MHKILFWLLAVSVFSCSRQTRVPDIQGIQGDIRFLDSLLQSPQIDSISVVQSNIESLILNFTGQTQTADQQAILDSITRINKTTADFLRFCIDSRSNIELLNSDISVTEMQYKSGKVNSNYYMTALVESEQILVNINIRFIEGRDRVLRSLKMMDVLKPMLVTSPLQ